MIWLDLCNFLGFLGSLFSLLQFLVSPIIGASSDIFGRKTILIMSMVSLKNT